MDAQNRLATYEDDQQDGPLEGRQWFTYAIGAVVMSASKMDLAAGNLYAALLNTDLEAVVAYGQPFENTRQACLAAIDALPATEWYDRARDALGRAKELYDDRNAVTHGVWRGEKGSVNNTRQAVRYRRHGKTVEVSWTQKGLMHLAAALVDSTNELTYIGDAVKLLRSAESTS